MRNRRRRLMSIALGGLLVLPIGVAPASAAASFLPYEYVLVPSQAEAVAIGDVTGDGRNDIVFTTGYDFDPANDFHLFVIAQGGDGTLGAPVRYATAGTYPERPGSIDLGDVTGDGRTDIVVGLDRLGIQVFPGTAAGTLGSPTFIASVDSTRVAIGNLDANAGLDVAGIGWGSQTVTTFSGGPAGLTKIATYAAKHGGRDDLEIGDVTGDGRDDLVVMAGQTITASLSVLRQITTGGFAPAVEYSTGASTSPHGIGLGDVSGDGRTDVVVSYGGNRPNSYVGVFPQTAAGTLGAIVSYTSHDIPEPVEVADLDRDGRAEVVPVHGGHMQVGVYGGMSDGTLGAEVLYPVPYASSYNPQGVAIGDIDGDGDPDIVEADYNTGLILLRNGSPPPPTAPSAPNLMGLLTGDGSIKAFWDSTTSDGGSPFLSFTATASPGGATCTILSNACWITGLTNGVAYTITVRATNAVGTSPASNALSATPRVEPSAPRNVTAKASGTGISIGWTAPLSTGGATITNYRVYRGTTSTSGSLIATVTGSARTFVDTTAPRKVAGFYWVTAVNVVGESVRSNVVSATRK